MDEVELEIEEEIEEEVKTKTGSRKKKTLSEKELEQRRTALEKGRAKKIETLSKMKKKAKELEDKEVELNVREKIRIENEEMKKADIKPEAEVVKEPKIKKKVQRIIEVSDDSSEEEVEEVYVKKPKANKKGVPQVDYIEMVKKTNAETLRKQLENERVRLAMSSCFPNMKF